MMIKKLLAAACAALIFALAFTASFASVPVRPEDGYVRDKADVLGEDTVDEIKSISAALKEKNGSGIYFIAVEGLDGAAIADYTASAFEKWDLTESEVMVVVDTAKGDYYVLCGKEISEGLNSNDLKDLLALSFEPAFSAGNVSAAALSFCNAVSAKIAELPLSGSGGTNTAAVILIAVFAAAAVVAVGLFILREVNISRARKRRRAARYLNSDRPLPPRKPRR